MSIHEFIRCYLAVAKTLARLTGGSYSVYQGGIPVILPSSGSIGNNGALTGITALPLKFDSCYMYFPANAISAGSTAGSYYVVMSSTTAGTIYNNTYTSGKPSAPASPTAFVTTGPGAFTQTTGSDIELINFPLPGGALGKNGSLYVYPHYSVISNGNNKNLRTKIDSTNIGSAVVSTVLQSTTPAHLRNMGAENLNVTSINAGMASAGTQAGFSTIDTSASVTVTVNGQLNVATDYIVLLGCLALVYPTN